jgi:hypothetical protein
MVKSKVVHQNSARNLFPMTGGGRQQGAGAVLRRRKDTSKVRTGACSATIAERYRRHNKQLLACSAGARRIT